jgi:L-iditol 2-dehydrogenase
MKALLLSDVDRLEYVEVPTPTPGPDDVLVLVEACGICGSDLHGMDGSSGRRIPPLVMGHEFSGVVEDVGRNVDAWRVGDRVVSDSTISCGQCAYCRRGLVNLCDNRRVLGVSCADYRRDGAFAQYVTVPGRVLYRLPEEVSFVEGAMVEPLSIAAHALARTSIDSTTTAVVVGSGMIGLLIVQALRAADCGRIIALDIDPHKLEQARSMGAEVVSASDPGFAAAAIRDLTDQQSANVAFEVVGKSATVGLAIDSVRKGGTVVLVGNLDPSVAMPLQAVVTREVTLVGTAASSGEYPWCIEMIAKRRLDVGSLVSAVAPLEDGAEWFERLRRGEDGLMKVVLRPNPQASPHPPSS